MYFWNISEVESSRQSDSSYIVDYHPWGVDARARSFGVTFGLENSLNCTNHQSNG